MTSVVFKCMFYDMEEHYISFLNFLNETNEFQICCSQDIARTSRVLDALILFLT
jgi:hypothetical protein